jgi:hypothetical protein
MGGACSSHGDEKWIQNFGLQRQDFRSLVKPGRTFEYNIKRVLKYIGPEGQDGVQWRSFVNTFMELTECQLAKDESAPFRYVVCRLVTPC